MILPSSDELIMGLKEVVVGVLRDAKADINEILPAADEIAKRAAFWGNKAISGDPSADQELILVQAQVEAVVARIYRQAQQQVSDRIMDAFGIVMKFILGAAVAL